MLTSAPHPSNKIGRKRFGMQAGHLQAPQNKAVGLVTRSLCERVVERATDMFIGRDQRNCVEEAGRREQIPTWVASHILAGELLAWQRYAKTLEIAIRNNLSMTKEALEMAARAKAEVWEEFL